MIPKTMPQAAMEAAEQAWQAHEGAARQKSLAALLMTFVSEKVRECVEEHGFQSNLGASALMVVSMQALLQFQKDHLVEVDLGDSTKYFVLVKFESSQEGRTYRLEYSDGLRALQNGTAPVKIHHFSSPYYATGHGHWDRHRTQAMRTAARMEDYFPRSISHAEPPTTSLLARSPG